MELLAMVGLPLHFRGRAALCEEFWLCLLRRNRGRSPPGQGSIRGTPCRSRAVSFVLMIWKA